MLECFEQEGPATSGGTQTFQSVSPAELHSAVQRKKSGQNVRLAHRPVACVPNSLDADGAAARGCRPARLHDESGPCPRFLAFLLGRRSRLPIELRWQAARLPYKFLIPMPH